MPPSTHDAHRVWMHGHDRPITVTRAAWLIEHGAGSIPDDCRVYRACGSYDCCNPRHLRCWTYRQWGEWARATGAMRTQAKAIANKVSGHRRSKVSYEMRLWLARTELPLEQAAAALGISPSWAHALKQRAAGVMAPRGPRGDLT